MSKQALEFLDKKYSTQNKNEPISCQMTETTKYQELCPQSKEEDAISLIKQNMNDPEDYGKKAGEKTFLVGKYVKDAPIAKSCNTLIRQRKRIQFCMHV